MQYRECLEPAESKQDYSPPLNPDTFFLFRNMQPCHIADRERKVQLKKKKKYSGEEQVRPWRSHQTPKDSVKAFTDVCVSMLELQSFSCFFFLIFIISGLFIVYFIISSGIQQSKFLPGLQFSGNNIYELVNFLHYFILNTTSQNSIFISLIRVNYKTNNEILDLKCAFLNNS